MRQYGATDFLCGVAGVCDGAIAIYINPAIWQFCTFCEERKTMKTFQCLVCGFIYDEAAGDPEHGINAGTLWADVPDSWNCPDCGVSKIDFEMVEI